MRSIAIYVHFENEIIVNTLVQGEHCKWRVGGGHQGAAGCGRKHWRSEERGREIGRTWGREEGSMECVADVCKNAPLFVMLMHSSDHRTSHRSSNVSWPQTVTDFDLYVYLVLKKCIPCT